MLAHGSTGCIDQYLRGEGRIVNLHVELEQLVVCLSANTFAHEVYTMTYIVQGIHALHLEYVCLVGREVRVGLYLFGHLFKRCTLFKLYIHHTAMYAFAHRDSHGESILDSLLGTYANAVPHGTARAEVGVCQSLGGKAFHQGAYYAVGTWIPTGSNDADGTTLLGCLVQGAAEVNDEAVNIKTVHCVDAQFKAFQCVLFHRTGGGGKNGYINIFQFLYVFYNGISFNFFWTSFAAGTTYNAGNFHI